MPPFPASRLAWPALLILPFAGMALAADSLRCGARIVSTGMLAAEVQAICGTPTYRDRWFTPAGAPGNFIAETEEWYYDFGPHQLLRILRFRNGRLTVIEADGHGYGTRPTPPCPPVFITEGLSKYRLRLHCGEPATREAAAVLQPWRDPRTQRLHPGQLEPVYRERWVYDFGPRHLIRIVTLEDGRVTEVDTGGRGSTNGG